jgi:hypothetical protein
MLSRKGLGAYPLNGGSHREQTDAPESVFIRGPVSAPVVPYSGDISSCCAAIRLCSSLLTRADVIGGLAVSELESLYAVF